MIKAIIVDDEQDARIVLRKMIELYCDDIVIAGEAGSAVEALKQINLQAPDIVFLDIEMAGGTGFDLLELVPDKSFETVFITAYGDYALKAIKSQPVDYLLKPIDPDELISAIEKCRQKIQKEIKPPEKIKLATEKQIVLLEPNEIIYIQADGRYSRVYLLNGKSYYLTKNIGEFEDELHSFSVFFRIHRSYLINLSHIMEVIREDSGYVLLRNNEKIEISRRKKSEFLQLIQHQTR